MQLTRSSVQGVYLCVSVGLLLTACGSGEAPPPVAEGATFRTQEEASFSGVVRATTTTGNALRYSQFTEPNHGTVAIDVSTGAFTYTPDKDYYGADAFAFRATDGHLISEPAFVSIQIQNVNDPPVLSAIQSMMNSPETFTSTVLLPVLDVDGDALVVAAISDDTDVATVVSNSTNRSLTISPLKRGTTEIRVTVNDADFQSEQVFSFMVGDVTKSRVFQAETSAGDSLKLTNTLAEPMEIALEHNGFPIFQSDEEMAQFVFDMPAEFPTEPFERKLWRFVRDSVYHHVPLSNDRWLYDPWVVINSHGWGFCGHVSAAYVRIARAAGYEARIWGLTGHVVPEIRIDGKWQIYDPDLAVYYFKQDGKVAGLEDLVADPSLLSSPVSPIFAGTDYDFPYGPAVTDIYATPADNYIGDNNFLARNPSEYQPLVLPAGASFTYPGRWSEVVTGVDGETVFELPYFLQGMYTIREGTTGPIALPWMLWEVRGTGRVRILGTTYLIGSPELSTAIQSSGRQIPNIEIVQSTGDVELIVFVNAMRYVLQGVNSVRITGKDVWAVNVDKQSHFSAENDAFPTASSFTKPIANISIPIQAP